MLVAAERILPYFRRHTKLRWLVAILRVSSILVFAIAAYALLGVWTGHLRFGQWVPREGDPGMAVNTASCFILISICLSGLAGYIHDQIITTRRPDCTAGARHMRRTARAGKRRSH